MGLGLLAKFFDNTSENIELDQSIVNDVLQQTQNKCVYTCKNVSNANITIVNTTIDGNLDVDQNCSIISSSCLLKTTMDNTVDNDISASLKQEEEDSANLLALTAGDSSTANSNINSSIRNLASQIIKNNCGGDSENDNFDNINILNSTVKGNVSIDQTSSISKSSCILNNILKNFNKNRLKTDVDQGINKTELYAVIIFVIILIIIVICLYIYYKPKTNNKKNNNSTQSEQVELVEESKPKNEKRIEETKV